ncbi:transposable element Tcb1 transposase [Trichonephila clavipes]|nr:transposable element Tcb1 transposase [Trichonephila clavipes]
MTAVHWRFTPMPYKYRHVMDSIRTAALMLTSLRYGSSIGPVPGIMVWGGIGIHCRSPLLRFTGTMNSLRCYISEVLEPVVLPCIQSLPSAIFQQDNARLHAARNVQDFLFTRQIELLPWPACSPDLSPIETCGPHRLVPDTPPVATPDQLWQYVEAGCINCCTPMIHPKPL